MALVVKAGALTDAAARNLVIKALRAARRAYRAADTAGEVEERDLDRLIKRKTRMNASQLLVLNDKYNRYRKLVDAVQPQLLAAMDVASNF